MESCNVSIFTGSSDSTGTYETSLFLYDRRFFRWIPLPLGWGRIEFWFVNLVKPLVRYMREEVGVMALLYIEDFLLPPSVGSVRTKKDLVAVERRVDGLLVELGLETHPTKGVWGKGAQG